MNWAEEDLQKWVIRTAACPLSHCTPVFPKEGSHTEAPIT